MFVGFHVPEKQNPLKSHEREKVTETKSPVESLSTEVPSQCVPEIRVH